MSLLTTAWEDIDFKSVAQFVGKHSTLIGDAISTASPLAGLLVTYLGALFNSTGDSADLLAKMAADPAVAEKLQEAELQHKSILDQDAVANQENARSREISIVEKTGKRDWVIDSLAVGVTTGFFGLCAMNYFVDIKDSYFMSILMGQVSSGFMLCLSYYFGSSSQVGSQRNN